MKAKPELGRAAHPDNGGENQGGLEGQLPQLVTVPALQLSSSVIQVSRKHQLLEPPQSHPPLSGPEANDFHLAASLGEELTELLMARLTFSTVLEA